MSRRYPGLLSIAMTSMVVAVFAGCIGGPEANNEDTASSAAAPFAVLKCMGPGNTLCNQEMTPDPERAGNEVTIAVNPTNPQNIVGGAKDYYPPDAGECVWDGIYVTHDGGATYADRSFDGSPWRLRNGDAANYEPNYASQFWCTTDPVAYFDTGGTLYYLLMAYQADPVTGSKTCENECPQGSLNDWAFNRAVQIVAVSDDGGDSFHTFTPVLEGSAPAAFHDKGWIAASADGTIHIMWLGIPAPGNVYLRSTDGGQTYSGLQVLAPVGGGSGQGSFIDVGVGDEVYATWVSGGGIQLRRSFDKGETWDPARSVLDIDRVSMPGHSARDRRGGYPSLATDRWEASPFAGAVYYAWQNAGVGGATDILFSASFDRGETFSVPIVLNDDILPSSNSEGMNLSNGVRDPSNWQLFPAISVSPGGVIDVSWMDTRLDDGDLLLDQFYTYSLDGGVTWSPNFRVRDADDTGWDTTLSFHQNGMNFIGDYNDIDSSWGAAHPVWPDTRHGLSDVFTAVIWRPMFADGWDAELRASTLADLQARGIVELEHPFAQA